MLGVHREFDFAANSNLTECFLKLKEDMKGIRSIGVLAYKEQVALDVSSHLTLD